MDNPIFANDNIVVIRMHGGGESVEQNKEYFNQYNFHFQPQ